MSGSTTTGPDLDPARLGEVAGVTFRLCTDLEADLPSLWAVQDASRAGDGELERNSLEGMSAYYRHLERCDPLRDLVVAEADGRMVGYTRVEWNDSNDGERWYEAIRIVDPAWRGRGIGARFLAWSETRRMGIAAEHAAAGEGLERVRALTTFTFDGDRGGRDLLERTGYVPHRRFASMRRPDLDDLPTAALPDGLEIRPIARETAALRQVFDADIEAFRDHFGVSEGTDERFAAFVEEPETDPDLWLVAFDRDEVAGAVLNGIHVSPVGERSGWLDSIFTRRPWRRRGLARALIARSLVLLRDRGMTSASLGVDLKNPNQAPALYESCGFRVAPGPPRSDEGGDPMIDTWIQLPDAPSLPGLRFRMFDPAHDYDALVDLLREANRADGVDYLPTVEGLRSDHEHGGEYDPRRDLILAEVDGVLVAAAETSVRTRDGIGFHHVEGWVRPASRRRGLGRALLHWTEARAAEVARVDGRPPTRALTAWPDEDQVGATALYASEGYEIVRYGYLMVRDLADAIPDLPIPDGLEIRPVIPADHHRIWEADEEAFRDHWGRAERTEADFDRWFAMPEIDTRLWRVAWDGDEVAGSVMPFIFPTDNELLGMRRGWLEHISTRRPWRRRGLASALIADSLRALRDAGMTEAALGVDAENVTGALRLYESLGFRRARTGVSYRKDFTAD